MPTPASVYIYHLRIRMSMPAARVSITPAPATLPAIDRIIRGLRRGLAWEREWLCCIR